ncbi:MAG: precorrin-6y C5,15-methyltransferase (decarboxylating) subunit CbiE [Pseudomonadota bacterium]
MIPVHVVGLGLGLDDLTPRLLEIINRAEVLAGSARLLDLFPDHQAQRLILSGVLSAWLEEAALAARSQQVVILASGDPGFFGVAFQVTERLGMENVVIHPNVTAVQAAFARLKMPWDDAALISLHGRETWQPLWSALAAGHKTAVYTDPAHTPSVIAQAMLERGLGAWRMHVLENLGASGERLGVYTLEDAAAQEFSPLNVTVLVREKQPPPLTLGMPEEEFEHEAGLITKPEIRAVILAGLALEPEHTLWDLGAGCGSVGLEATLLLPRGRVVAVERQEDRLDQIKANRKKFGAAGLEVVQADLPDGLDGLPDPDRVFIGGGGSRAPEIIRAAALRLPHGGIMVAAAVNLDNLEKARTAMSAAGLSPQVTQVQISRSAALAGDQYLKPLNPVWLVKGRKPGKTHE